MQLKWKKTLLPEEDFIRSPIYETSFHFYNDNNLSVDVNIHVTIAIDKIDKVYILYIYDNTDGILLRDKETIISDIPLHRYDLSSILVFAHEYIDFYMKRRYLFNKAFDENICRCCKKPIKGTVHTFLGFTLCTECFKKICCKED